MPWTGYERKIAPHLTALAERSTVYTHAYAVSTYTAKSVGALLTSQYPSSLYRTGWFFTGYSKGNLFLTEVLQDEKVRTISGQAHMYFARGKNLDQGFDVWELTPGISFDPQTDNHVTSHKMTDLAIELLGEEENSKGQFFAWFHYMDPHDQYIQHDETPDWGKTNRDRYDSEVFYTDLHLGRLFDWGAKQTWWKDTAIIVSADHGEAFGEHDFYKHAFWLWDVLARVPLIIHVPGVEPQRIDERRSHIDLAPTILDLMGIREAPASFVGTTLVPEIYQAEKPKTRSEIVLDLPADSHNPEIKAVISGNYKIIVYGNGWRQEVFDLSKDPDEENDLSKSDPDLLAKMKKTFEDTWAKIPIVKPSGGMKLRGGGTARGPMNPPKAKD